MTNFVKGAKAAMYAMSEKLAALLFVAVRHGQLRSVEFVKDPWTAYPWGRGRIPFHVSRSGGSSKLQAPSQKSAPSPVGNRSSAGLAQVADQQDGAMVQLRQFGEGIHNRTSLLCAIQFGVEIGL